MQHELTKPSPLLDERGELAQVGWARQPLLDCNLENAAFYRLRVLQSLRLKRWDYYGLTTPTHYFSFTLADLGYAGQVFAYVVDFEARRHHEETLTLPPFASLRTGLARGIHLPRNSTQGRSTFDKGRVKMTFEAQEAARHISVHWPGFEDTDLSAKVALALPPEHESMAIVIPIAGKRFYYNRKVNCLPAEGWVEYRGQRLEVRPSESLGNLDWGRGPQPEEPENGRTSKGDEMNEGDMPMLHPEQPTRQLPRPLFGVHLATRTAYSTLAAERHSYCLPTVQADVRRIPILRIPTAQHLLHFAQLMSCHLTCIDALVPLPVVPVLDDSLERPPSRLHSGAHAPILAHDRQSGKPVSKIVLCAMRQKACLALRAFGMAKRRLRMIPQFIEELRRPLRFPQAPADLDKAIGQHDDLKAGPEYDMIRPPPIPADVKEDKAWTNRRAW